MLELKGHRVLGAAFDGKECLEEINSYDLPPDYVLLDHRMPGMNGFNTLKELLKRNPNLQIIFISADDSIEKDVLEHGAVSFIKKPFDLQTFYSKLEVIST